MADRLTLLTLLFEESLVAEVCTGLFGLARERSLKPFPVEEAGDAVTHVRLLFGCRDVREWILARELMSDLV